MNNHSLIVILDNIRSASNIGAIFRTCDGGGVGKLILCGISARPPHKELMKTALGTTESVPWEYWEKTTTAIDKLRSDGYSIIAVEQTGESVNYKEFNYPEKIALIFGNEVDGVSPEALELCDAAIDLPMRGKAKSLNVATAAGIILYHLT